jgi:O-antigen/teichoic acid export membrane protein
MGRHGSYLAATAAGAIAGVLLYLVLIPTFGLTGAGLAFVLAEVAVAVTAYLQLSAEVRGVCRNPLLGTALAAALPLFVAVRIVNAHTTQIYLVVSAGALAYLLSCGWFIRKTLVQQFSGLR